MNKTIVDFRWHWNTKAQLVPNHQGPITKESGHPSMPCQAVPMETTATSRVSGNMPVPKGQGLSKGSKQYSGISEMFPPFSGRSASEAEQKVKNNESHSDPHSQEISHTHNVLKIGVQINRTWKDYRFTTGKQICSVTLKVISYTVVMNWWQQMVLKTVHIFFCSC